MPCKVDTLWGEMSPYDGGFDEYINNPLYKKLYDKYILLKKGESDSNILLEDYKNLMETKVCFLMTFIEERGLVSDLENKEYNILKQEHLLHKKEDVSKELRKLIKLKAETELSIRVCKENNFRGMVLSQFENNLNNLNNKIIELESLTDEEILKYTIIKV